MEDTPYSIPGSRVLRPGLSLFAISMLAIGAASPLTRSSPNMRPTATAITKQDISLFSSTPSIPGTWASFQCEVVTPPERQCYAMPTQYHPSIVHSRGGACPALGAARDAAIDP